MSVGRYTILNKVAEHGQGVIYRADHPELHRPVIIKISRRQLSPAEAQSLRVEGRALATLDHPNIARVYDLEIENGRPMLVMEYIEGLSVDRSN